MSWVFGGPGIALISSFFAIGALTNDSGFSFLQNIVFSLICFALPGQLVAAELYAAGSGLLVVTATVLLVNCRLLPMTVVLLPLLKDPGQPEPAAHRRWNLLIVHWVAVTSWVCYLASYRSVPPPHRRRYFIIMSALLWLNSLVASALGYWVGDFLPHQWLVGLLFLNPAYFLCIMLRSLFKRNDFYAFLAGMLLLPPVHYFLPEWDILLTGLIVGTAVFYYDRRRS